MKRLFPFLQLHSAFPMDSLRVRWVPLVPSFQRLGAFAFSPHPGVHGSPVLRLLRPIRHFLRHWGFVGVSLTYSPLPFASGQEASRVHNEGLKQNAVGGVLLNAPSPLWGSPIFLQGRIRLTWSPMRSHPMQEAWVPALHKTHGRLDRLTSQARSVRGHFSRRAMHASGDSPWHSSAKHHILEACFFRMTPFRSMLRTLQDGLHS